MIWGFISPGIVAVFVFGLLVRRAPAAAAVTAMLFGVPVYGALLWAYHQVAFLNHMAITFGVLVAVMALITIIMPLREPVRFERTSEIDLTPSRLALGLGVVVCVLTVILYIIFW
jgi:SSS family solute:Na+ symporter